MEKQTGFLLSYIKYGDNDAVLHCYTKEAGFQSFFVKGLYSSKNKKKAYLFPLNELSITFSAHKTSLQTVKKIEFKKVENEISDIRKSTIIFFIADFLNQILKNEPQNEILYNEVREFRNNLLQNFLHTHYLFLIKILRFFGIAPLVSSGKYLSIEKGIFLDIEINCLNEEISDIWKKALQQCTSYDVVIEKKNRKALLDSILLYYKAHFPDFYVPKSLSVILEIFE